MNIIRRVAALAALALAVRRARRRRRAARVGRRRRRPSPGRSPTTSPSRQRDRRLHQSRGLRRRDRAPGRGRRLQRRRGHRLAGGRRPRTSPTRAPSPTPGTSTSPSATPRSSSRVATAEIVADVAWAIPATGLGRRRRADDVRPGDRAPWTATRSRPRPTGRAGSWAPELLAALPDVGGRVLQGHRLDASTPARRRRRSPPRAGRRAPTDPAVAVETSYDGNAVLIDVDGTGFTAVTKPGDAGRLRRARARPVSSRRPTTSRTRRRSPTPSG